MAIAAVTAVTHDLSNGSKLDEHQLLNASDDKERQVRKIGAHHPRWTLKQRFEIDA